MGFWDGIAGDILVGAVSVAGFAVGGPIGAAVAGGIAGGAVAGLRGENILAGAGFGAAGGIVGGLGGVAVKGAAKGVVGGLFRQGHSAAAAARVTGPAASKIAAGRSADGLKGLFLNKIPSKLGGAHLSPWKTYFGLLGSATTPPAFVSIGPETYYKYAGYPPIPLIDISEEELSDIPDKMPHVFMPDPNRIPDGLEFTQPMQTNYRTLPATYLGLWKGFGEKPAESGESPLPKEFEVADIEGEQRSNMPSYTERVAGMRETYQNLRSLSEVVATAVQRTGELCEAGRTDIKGSTGALKELAGSDPRDDKRISAILEQVLEEPSRIHATEVGSELARAVPMFEVDGKVLTASLGNEDAYAMVLIESALGSAETVLQVYSQAFAALADDTKNKGPEPGDKGDKGGGADKGGEDKSGSGRSGDSSQDPNFAPTGAGNRNETGANDSDTSNTADDVPTPEPLDLTGTADTGSGNNAGDASSVPGDSGPGIGSSATNGSGSPTGARMSPVSVPSPAVAAGAGTGSGIESFLLPQILQSLMNRGTGAGGRSEDDERSRRERPARQPGGPAATPARPTAQPAVTTHAAAAASTASATQAKTVSAAPSTTPPPGTARPDSGGNVTYTFPDGRTQEVSAVVARALDTAFGNAAGTDAQAAYTGTDAAWTDAKRIGERVDPNRVMTGDVGAWEDRTALLVAFGPDAAALEAVVDGALRQVTSLEEMNDGAGSFGPFVGLFHPPGIEKTESGSADTALSGGAVDQSVATAAAPA